MLTPVSYDTYADFQHFGADFEFHIQRISNAQKHDVRLYGADVYVRAAASVTYTCGAQAPAPPPLPLMAWSFPAPGAHLLLLCYGLGFVGFGGLELFLFFCFFGGVLHRFYKVDKALNFYLIVTGWFVLFVCQCFPL